MRPELNSLFGNLASCFFILDDIPQGDRTDHGDRMTLKIVLELPARHENSIHQLLPMWVPLLRLDKHLTDIINQSLNRILLSGLLAFHNNSHTNSPGISSHI